MTAASLLPLIRRQINLRDGSDSSDFRSSDFESRSGPLHALVWFYLFSSFLVFKFSVFCFLCQSLSALKNSHWLPSKKTINWLIRGGQNLSQHQKLLLIATKKNNKLVCPETSCAWLIRGGPNMSHYRWVKYESLEVGQIGPNLSH